MKMTPFPPQDDQLPTQFEQWLRAPVPGDTEVFLNRLRERLQHPEQDVDLLVDAMLEPDGRFQDPRFLFRLRARLLEESKPSAWAKWARALAPLAAAAAVAFAVVSVSQPPHSADQANLTRVPSEPILLNQEQLRNPESDLTRILALASTLPAATDLSRLQSESALALLQQ